LEIVRTLNDTKFPQESQMGSPDHHPLHWDVNCDGCGSTRLLHYRYKCLRCPDYDLCAECHEDGVTGGDHERGHPFQCLLDRAARELHFAGGTIPDLCADSFTCPLCSTLGLSAGNLMDHCQAKHHMMRIPVICPLCVAVPSSHPHMVTNLANHLALWHPSSILRDQESPESRVSPLPDFPWRSLAGIGTGRATHHRLPSAQVPQVRYLAPRGTPPLATSEDLSDEEI
ncbi:hypothetical protein KR084_005726, partial [Drosophila pseudotakahashii]